MWGCGSYPIRRGYIITKKHIWTWIRGKWRHICLLGTFPRIFISTVFTSRTRIYIFNSTSLLLTKFIQNLIHKQNNFMAKMSNLTTAQPIYLPLVYSPLNTRDNIQHKHMHMTYDLMKRMTLYFIIFFWILLFYSTLNMNDHDYTSTYSTYNLI